MKSRIRKIRRAYLRHRVGQVRKVGKPAVRLGRNCAHLVAKAGIDCQVLQDTDIVLNIRAKERLANTKGRYWNRKQSNEVSWPVRQQRRKSTALENVIGSSC